MDTKLKTQLTKEIWAINETLVAFNINAGTKPAWTAIGGDQLVIYTLKTGRGQAISDIERRLPELSEAISAQRRRQTLVRLLRYPLRLEVTHPNRQPLAWDGSAINGQPHSLLLGRTYDGGAADLWLPFDDAPHILVAGTTGAGKSVEIANMLLGLCWNTSPAELRIALVDLKATDLVPFRRLPHVDTLATDIEPATEVLRKAEALRKAREGNNGPLPRLLVVVDEYADIAKDKRGVDSVDSVARKGRSANVNLLVATQHPTGETMGSTTIKSNFKRRVVGSVTDATAASNAAGIPGTHAELLPGKGAFLLIGGEQSVQRFQSYRLTEADIESLITKIGRKWREEKPTAVLEPVSAMNHSALVVEPSKTSAAPVTGGSRTAVLFPIDGRKLTPTEADECRRLHKGGMSKNELCRTVYGSKNGKYMVWISEALDIADDNKIIRLPRTGTDG